MSLQYELKSIILARSRLLLEESAILIIAARLMAGQEDVQHTLASAAAQRQNEANDILKGLSG